MFVIMGMNDILTITLTLFAVVDILGALPLIISIRQKKRSYQLFSSYNCVIYYHDAIFVYWRKYTPFNWY